MDGFDQFSGGALVAVVAVLWLLYLVPSWMQRRRYMATERQVTRMQQALRVMSGTAGEGADLVEAELNARRVAELAREAKRQKKLTVRMERQKAHAITEEKLRVERVRAAQEREVARLSAEVEAARIRADAHKQRNALRQTPEFRAAARRRGRLASTAVLAGGLVAFLAGVVLAPRTIAAWWVLAGGVALVLVAISMLNALARVARAQAHPVRRPVAHPGVVIVDAEEEEGSVRAAAGATAPNRAEPEVARPWTPHPLPQPLAMTREQVWAAAQAEAAAVASAGNDERDAAQVVAEADSSEDAGTAVGALAGSGAGIEAAGGAGTGAEAAEEANVEAAEEPPISADVEQELRDAAEEAVAALRAAEESSDVAPIETAREEDFGWLLELDKESADAAAESAAQLDEVLRRRRSAS